MITGNIRGKRAFVAALALAATAALTSSDAEAQMSKATFEALPIPGAPNFPAYRQQSVVTETVPPIGSSFGKTYRNYAKQPTASADNPDNVQYVKLPFPGANAKVTINPYWTEPVAKGSYQIVGGQRRWTDNCGHSHFGYEVMMRMLVWTGAGWDHRFIPYGGEGRIGRRYGFSGNKYGPVDSESNPNAPCYVTSDPDPTGFLAPFIWKNNTANFAPFRFLYNVNTNSSGSITSGVIFLEAFVAMQSATHGWGGCGNFQCFPPVGLQLWQTN